MANEAEVLARVTALLAADPVCMGKVNTATVRQIAQIVAFPEPVPDADVLAEREACVRLMGAAHARLSDGPMGGDPDEWGKLEARRLSEAMRSIGLGLHREAGEAA